MIQGFLIHFELTTKFRLQNNFVRFKDLADFKEIFTLLLFVVRSQCHQNSKPFL